MERARKLTLLGKSPDANNASRNQRVSVRSACSILLEVRVQSMIRTCGMVGGEFLKKVKK